MPEFDPAAEFPNMTPIKKAPTMMRINGCGTAAYGSRDVHGASGAYVTTLCVTILYVPILMLRAYRVARAPQGWYFLGKEPLSLLAKTFNISVIVGVLGIVGAVWWNSYTSSPEYQAAQKMHEAQSLANSGELDKAAEIYSQLAAANAEQADNARQALAQLVDTRINDASLARAAAVITTVSHLSTRNDSLANSHLVDRAMTLVNEKAAADPAGGIVLLNAARPLAIDTRPIDKARLPLLQAWAAKEPQNLDAVVPLASLFESQDKLDDAKKLLLPVQSKLGDGEGARVLGTIYVHEGDLEAAYRLLWPYVKVRLDALHAAEADADTTAERLWKREIQELNENKAPASFYSRHAEASKEDQDRIVQEYVNPRVRKHPDYLRSQSRLEESAAVVPVALELGIVMLQRAHGLADPQQKKAQLESAEKVFLAIRGIAGQTDAYRLSLGEVYYWLGKQSEGQALFDEYLKSKGRTALALLQIAAKLRAVGADSPARTMAEQAYAAATDNQVKYGAAMLRSRLNIDTDDGIKWLDRCDPTDPGTRAELQTAMGDRAFENGRDEQGIAHMKSALEAYATLPRDTDSLNNTALVHYRLFMATHDRASLDRSFDLLQQAVNLSPSDRVVLINAATLVSEATLADVLGQSLDVRTLRAQDNLTLLSFLYNSPQEKNALQKRLQDHPGYARTMSYLEKTMVLAPKSPEAYSRTYNFLEFTRDLAGMQALQEKLKLANPDTSDNANRTREFISGEKDKTYAPMLQASAQHAKTAAEAARAKGGRTAAVALSIYARDLMEVDLVTHNSDPSQIVSLAEEAHRIAPSAGTSSTLLGAYLFRVHNELSKANPHYRDYTAPCYRSLGPVQLVCIAAIERSELASAIRIHPDFQKAVALRSDLNARFPDDPGVTDWLLAKAAGSPDAEKFADAIRKDPRVTLDQSLESTLYPARPSTALSSWFLETLYNRPAEAQQQLDRMKSLGIAVPQLH